MFDLFYTLGIKFYALAIHFFAFFNKKARLFVQGRKNIFEKIRNSYKKETLTIWFHVSSLGEFEQARPLIEKIKDKHPNYQIVVTFFSPSGYEIRKNYQFADAVFYLPLDTKKNAKKFIELIKPDYAIFVKYEFWYFYLKILHQAEVKTFLISGIFRENQIFFKKIGKSYAKVLNFFTHLFVQNEKSMKLLQKIGITDVTVTGDTRFDRVIEIAENSDVLPVLEKFKDGKICIVAGSTWHEDEQILVRYINTASDNIKFIIAPHEVDEAHIKKLLTAIKKKTVRFTEVNAHNVADYDVMIIDTIGILSKAYKYGEVAYIGGGFGVGIHNIIEAAVYGMPVVFGTNYKKFQEAVDLIKLNAAISIKNFEELKKVFDNFLNDKELLQKTSETARQYVYSNKGASKKIIDFIFSLD